MKFDGLEEDPSFNKGHAGLAQRCMEGSIKPMTVEWIVAGMHSLLD